MAAAPDLNPTETSYLKAMLDHCEADPGKQVSMYAVGETLGMDRDQASQVCQELIAFGLVEIRTLSGGVGITADGLALGGPPGPGAGVAAGAQLKPGPILDDEDSQAVTAALEALKQSAAQWKLSYDQMAEFVADVKTIEVQLLSPRPKTAVIKAVCDSLAAFLDTVGDSAAAARVNALRGG